MLQPSCCRRLSKNGGLSYFWFFSGVAGWLLFLIQPPYYEANVSVLVNVDFSNTGALTQFEEDAMMDAVGGGF